MSFSGSINSFFQNNGITGNPLVDSLIIANLIPLLLSYINNVTTLFSKIIMIIAKIIFHYMKFYFKAKVIGNTLCTIKISENTELYNFIKTKIFDTDVGSDINKKDYFYFFNIIDVQDETKADVETWYDKLTKMDKRMEVDINYYGGNVLKAHSYIGFDDKKQKIFKYKSFLVRITHLISEKLKDMTIDLISFDKSSRIEDKNKHVEQIELFLKERFSISENISYVYKLTVMHKNLTTAIQNLLNYGYLDSGTGLLKYGNELHESNKIKSESRLLTNNLSINIKCTNLNDSKIDYKDYIEFYENNFNSGTQQKSIDFKYFYRKHISALESYQNYGYFMKEKKIFLIYHDGRNCHIAIVSEGKLMSEKDLKENIDWLIKLSIDSKGNNLEKVNKNNVYISKRQGTNWQQYVLEKRTMDTIFLPHKQMAEIKLELDNFLKLEKLYSEYQIPYKKGLLFYGPPGTGKTSLVKSLAYEYQIPIFIMNINDDEVNDDSIVDILNSIGGGTKILLFEDIDSAFADKGKMKNEIRINDENKMDERVNFMKGTRDSDKKVEMDMVSQFSNVLAEQLKKSPVLNKKFLTYSGLLNALDGVMSNQNGVITIMTTNDLTKLGDAFIRPGRIDKLFELKECNEEQIISMTTGFIRKRNNVFVEDKNIYKQDQIDESISQFAQKLVKRDKTTNIKPCELQFYLLKYIENVDEIFRNYNELLNKK